MILRRITEHVKAQNWFAVGIDFFIVVVGVFIGIQVANWNDARAVRQQTQQLIERLDTSLGVDAWVANFFYNYHQSVLDHSQQVIDDLTGKMTLSDEAFIIAAYRASQFGRLTNTDSTYDELVASGGLGLVAGTELGKIASLFYRNNVALDIENSGKEASYRRIFRMVTPVAVQRAALKACGDSTVSLDEAMAGNAGLGYACEIDLPDDELAAAADILRKHPEIENALRHRLISLEQQMQDFRSLLVATESYRASREELIASEQFNVILGVER